MEALYFLKKSFFVCFCFLNFRTVPICYPCVMTRETRYTILACFYLALKKNNNYIFTYTEQNVKIERGVREHHNLKL